MIQVSNSVASLWEDDARWLDAKLYDWQNSSWVEVPNEIQNFTVTKGVMSDGEFELGGAVCPSCNVTLFNSYQPTSSRLIRIDIGIDTGGTTVGEVYTPNFSYITLGSFYIDKLEVSKYESVLTCTSELLGRLGGTILSGKPTSPTAIISSVGSLFGVAINNNLGVTDIPLRKALSGKTCREALSIVAKSFGGCVYEGYNNMATLSIVNPMTVDATKILYVSEDRLEKDFVSTGSIAFGSAKISVDTGADTPTVYSFGGEPYIYQDDNEYMTSALFSKFQTAFKDKAYASGEVSMLMGDPRIEPLDRIALYRLDEQGQRVVSATVPVFYVEHRYDGSLTTTAYAPVPQDYSNLVDDGSKKLTAVIGQINNIRESVDSYDEQIETIVTRLEGVDEGMRGKVDSSLVKGDVETGSMEWVEDDNSLHIIGKNAEGNATYETVVGGDGIKFKYNGETVASVDQDQLVIDKTIVFTSMQVGNWKWEVQQNDNLTLKWGGN